MSLTVNKISKINKIRDLAAIIGWQLHEIYITRNKVIE